MDYLSSAVGGLANVASSIKENVWDGSELYRNLQEATADESWNAPNTKKYCIA